MPIIDHITVNVTDYARAKVFYTKVLAALDVKLVMEFGMAAGFGRNGKPDFWVGQGKTTFQTEAHASAPTPIHVCFVARSRDEVDAFHRAALEAGGRDFGAPGVRAHYHENYYGAFVLDPDGHNIEAVFHGAVGYPGPAS